MDYCKIYNSLIGRAKTRILECYCEKHHVIPKCVGGSDESSNIVKLTAEEHYVAHQLLLKIYPNTPQLIYAAHMMTVGRTTNKLYGWIKRRWIENIKFSQKGKKNSQFGKIWITNGEINKKWNKLELVPCGWFAGRKNLKPPRTVTNYMTCPTCKKMFLQKKKNQIFCCKFCVDSRKRNSLIEVNFVEMKEIYEETKSVSAAFRGVGISRNGYLAKEFLDLYAGKT